MAKGEQRVPFFKRNVVEWRPVYGRLAAPHPWRAAPFQCLWQRNQRAGRAEGVPGNLRRQNRFVVDRREELRGLHEQLATGAVGLVTAVHGRGGQGKTELDIEYAHAFADDYGSGDWQVRCASPSPNSPLPSASSSPTPKRKTPTFSPRAPAAS